VRIVASKVQRSELQFDPNSPIAQGIFGQVYKGICRGEVVAIKELFGIQMAPQVAQEFLHEVQIMTALSHKNVLRLHGCCTETQFGQNNWYLVVEWMENGSLSKVLQSTLPLSLERKVQFALDIASGMNWLHSSEPQILHRDLKPDNVLVDKDFTCKVADFGLAEINRQRHAKKDQGNAPGSVLWMAPEVLTGGPVDSKLDVYAFGLVLWEIMTRQMVFNDYVDRAVFTYDIVQNKVRPPTKDIPDPIVNVMRACWDHNPNQRPTFAQVIIMLQHALIDCFLPSDSQENNFWKNNFGLAPRVPVDQFILHLFNYVNYVPHGTMTKIVQEFLTSTHQEGSGQQDKTVVTLYQFKNFLHWFGPLRHPQGITILDRIEELLQKPWFFGTLSAEMADTTLASCPDGYFLVRMNLGGNRRVEESPFTLVRKYALPQTDHIRIYPIFGGGGNAMDLGHISYNPSGFKVKFTCTYRGQTQVHSKTVQVRSSKLEDFILQLQIQEPVLFVNDLSKLPKSAYHLGPTRYVDDKG